jgi:hypothetical protein
MGAPPRMCAVVGMFAVASKTLECAVPPVRALEPLGHRVRDRDEGRVGLLAILLGAEPEPAGPAARRTEGDRVVAGLHDEEDERPAAPAHGPEPAQRAERMAEDGAQEHERTGEARAVAGERREEQRHEVALAAVGAELDVRVLARVDARADRDVEPRVAPVVGHGDGEDRLAVGADELAEPRSLRRGQRAASPSASGGGDWCRARRPRRSRRAPCAVRRSFANQAPGRSVVTR